MRVYCTNPNCPHPEKKDFTENLLNINPKEPRYCDRCRTDLILENRYLALEEIGSGGFGKTFLAHDFTWDQECAIKILRPLQRLKPPDLELVEKAFQQGAKILKKLKHEQIPSVDDYFNLKVSDQNFFYLVQSYIPGQTLDRELANKNHKRFSETEVVEVLRSLLEIISYTHSQNVIHRDVKPSNIIRHQENHKLYLIDFDTAIKRDLEPGVPVNQSRAMGTPGYAPPEQLSGRDIYPSADLYAIAATCVYLLTGREPAQICNTTNLLQQSWRIYVPNVAEHLAEILDKMLSPEPMQRYQSATEVLEALSPISKLPDTVIPPPNPIPITKPAPTIPPTIIPPKNSIFQWFGRIPKWSYLIGLPLFAILFVFVFKSCTQPVPADVSCISDNNFSCGEKRLISQEDFRQEIEAKAKQVGKTAFQEFDAGTAAFQRGLKGDKEAFSEAQKHFNEQLKIHRNDPEARIALNNAKAAENGNFVKIAVCVPEQGIAEEFLRGVAIVQEEINNNNSLLINRKMLFIQICTDGDTDDQAKSVAKKLIAEKAIVGVIGHYTSNTTKTSGDIYDGELVAISPTSTAVRNNNYQLSDYVFRVSPDASLSAKKLIEYIRDQQRKNFRNFNQPKVAILSKHLDDKNNRDDYNQSLIEEFKKELQPIEVHECNLAEPNKNIPNCMNQAREQKANFLLIAISNDVLEKSNNASEIFLNREDMILLAGNATYSTKANISRLANNLIISVQWVRSEGATLSELERQANNMFGGLNTRVLINFRTAMTYDATKAMVAGLRNVNGNITRQKLYEELKKSTFSAKGANVDVKFKNGDRQFDASNENKLMFLVTPVQSSKDGVTQFKEVQIN